MAANNSHDGPSDSMLLPSKAADLMSDDWTEEKHKSFLNSMEASFVKELYSNRHGSDGLLGYSSRTQIHSNPTGPDTKSQSSGQFKVLRGGCWEKLKFDRADVQAKNGNEFQKLSENPWIQHFKTQTSVKDQHLTPADSMDNYNLVDQSVQFVDWRRGREAMNSKQAFFRDNLNQLSVDSIAEVSDQNFVDVEVDKREEPSRRTGKKRVRKAVSPINDQVVPFVSLSSDEQGTLVKEKNDGGSSTNLAAMGGSSSFQT